MAPTPIQIVAYLTGAVLLAYAWRSPRLRAYAALTLGADVLRAALQLTSSKHAALYAADSAVALAALCAAPWALGLDLVAVGMFAACLVVPLADAARRGADNGWRVYAVAALVVHLYSAVAGAVAAKRRKARVSPTDALLLALATTGASGAVLALAWRDWDVVCAGNIVAGCVVAGAAGVLGERLDERR